MGLTYESQSISWNDAWCRCGCRAAERGVAVRNVMWEFNKNLQMQVTDADSKERVVTFQPVSDGIVITDDPVPTRKEADDVDRFLQKPVRQVFREANSRIKS